MPGKRFTLSDQFGEDPIKEYKLYNGRITLLYNDADHQYFIDGPHGRFQVYNASAIVGIVDKSQVLIPWAVKMMAESLEEMPALGAACAPDYLVSITRAHLLLLIAEAKKAHRNVKQKAGDIGGMAHNWLEQYGRLRIRGISHETAKLGPRPDNIQANNCINAALDWIDVHNVRPMYVERKVYSEQDNACGTTDWIGMVDGKLTILDFKSSKYVYDEHRFQLAFYRSAFEEETGRKIEQSILLRLGKEDGVFEPHVFAGDDAYGADLMAFRAALILYDRTAELKAEAKEEKEKVKAEAKLAKALAKKAA